MVAAVVEGIRDHVAALKSRGAEFYGYALLPGEPYDIGSLVAVSNGEADIEVPSIDGQHRYCRYCVDEWEHWEYDGFRTANTLLAEANEQFASLHTKGDDDFEMDEFEVAYSEALLEAVVQGLGAAKDAGVFGGEEPFLAVWISDSGHPIIADSVRRLNSPEVVRGFIAEFG